MDPSGLSAAAYAFGQCFEAWETENVVGVLCYCCGSPKPVTGLDSRLPRVFTSCEGGGCVPCPVPAENLQTPPAGALGESCTSLAHALKVRVTVTAHRLC